MRLAPSRRRPGEPTEPDLCLGSTAGCFTRNREVPLEDPGLPARHSAKQMTHRNPRNPRRSNAGTGSLQYPARPAATTPKSDGPCPLHKIFIRLSDGTLATINLPSFSTPPSTIPLRSRPPTLGFVCGTFVRFWRPPHGLHHDIVQDATAFPLELSDPLVQASRVPCGRPRVTGAGHGIGYEEDWRVRISERAASVVCAAHPTPGEELKSAGMPGLYRYLGGSPPLVRAIKLWVGGVALEGLGPWFRSLRDDRPCTPRVGIPRGKTSKWSRSSGCAIGVPSSTCRLIRVFRSPGDTLELRSSLD